MNIALVVLDTVRKDAFERHFNWLPGRRYERAWSTSNWTVPVHASLFTGYYASETGVHSTSTTLDCEETVLAEWLAESGYTTRAFSANPNVSKRFDFHRGFDEFSGSWKVRHFNSDDIFDWSGFMSDTRNGGVSRYLKAVSRCITEDVATIDSLKQGFNLKFRPGSLNNDLIDDGASAALKRIRETEYGDDEFLFLNLMEAHGPYEPPEEYRTVSDYEKPTTVDAIVGVDGVDEDAVRRAYDDAVRYLSDIYSEVFDELREDFDYVITLSDHGEMLGEHGLWDHQYGLYPELTHVPLVISGKELDGTTDATVSLLDVHRTVLSLAGIDAPSRGRDLLDDAGRECLTEYHGMTQWLLDELAREIDLDTIRETYEEELSGCALPPAYYGHETRDGWAEYGEADDDPRDRFDELRDDVTVRETDVEQAELSEEAMERLEDLGYA